MSIELQEFLAETTVAAHLGSARLFRHSIACLQVGETVAAALETLREHKLQSAPVQDGEKIVGSVDVLDLVHFILHAATADERRIKHAAGDQVDWGQYVNDFSDLQRRGAILNGHTVGEVMGAHNNKNVVNWIFEGEPDVVTLLDLVSGPLKTSRRVVVQSRSGEDKAIVSHFDIASAVYKFLRTDAGRSLGSRTVDSEALGTRAPITMSSSAPVLAAFHLMVWNDVSAVAILNPDGQIVANLSAADVRGVTSENLGKLTLPAADFLAERVALLRGGSLVVRPPTHPVVVQEHTTVDTVLFKLTSFHLHRVWIEEVASAGTPSQLLGLISVSDVVDWVNTLAFKAL